MWLYHVKDALDVLHHRCPLTPQMLSASRLISTRALPHAFALGTHPWHRMSSTLPPSHPNVVASAKARGGTSGVVEEGDLPEGRIVETELRHEAERSYMAVRFFFWGGGGGLGV